MSGLEAQEGETCYWETRLSVVSPCWRGPAAVHLTLARGRAPGTAATGLWGGTRPCASRAVVSERAQARRCGAGAHACSGEFSASVGHSAVDRRHPEKLPHVSPVAVSLSSPRATGKWSGIWCHHSLFLSLSLGCSDISLRFNLHFLNG